MGLVCAASSTVIWTHASGACQVSRGTRAEREDVAALGTVLDRDAAVVGLGDPGHDRQAQAAAFGLVAIAPPETPEDRVTLGLGHAGAVIDDPHGAVGGHVDLDRAAARGVPDGVIDEIAHGPEQRLGMAPHPDRRVDAGERDRLGHVDGKRRHEAYRLGPDGVETALGIAADAETLTLG